MEINQRAAVNISRIRRRSQLEHIFDISYSESVCQYSIISNLHSILKMHNSSEVPSSKIRKSTISSAHSTKVFIHDNIFLFDQQILFQKSIRI